MKWSDLKMAIDARDRGQAAFIVTPDGQGVDPMERVARQILGFFEEDNGVVRPSDLGWDVLGADSYMLLAYLFREEK